MWGGKQDSEEFRTEHVTVPYLQGPKISNIYCYVTCRPFISFYLQYSQYSKFHSYYTQNAHSSFLRTVEKGIIHVNVNDTDAEISTVAQSVAHV